MTEFFAKQRVSTGRPAGWHFMNEYVDKDGNVFHKGKEQPELKGTLKPTEVKKRKKKKKLTEDEKLVSHSDVNVVQHETLDEIVEHLADVQIIGDIPVEVEF